MCMCVQLDERKVVSGRVSPSLAKRVPSQHQSAQVDAGRERNAHQLGSQARRKELGASEQRTQCKLFLSCIKNQTTYF